MSIRTIFEKMLEEWPPQVSEIITTFIFCNPKLDKEIRALFFNEYKAIVENTNLSHSERNIKLTALMEKFNKIQSNYKADGKGRVEKDPNVKISM